MPFDALVTDAQIRRVKQKIDKVLSKNTNYLSHLKYTPSPLALGAAVYGHQFDEWQAAYLASAPKQHRVAIAASRQSGKSTVTACFAAWCLLFIPGFQCLVASRSLRQASHFLLKVREIILAVIPADAMPVLNRLSLQLPNKSEIVSIPCAQPDAGRGFSPHLIILDEAAFAPDALFTAILPSVAATRGALHMISSPNGRQGRFFEAFEGEAQSVYWSQKVTWHDCPRMDQEQMDAEKLALGELMWRQEFMSEFIMPYGAFFGAGGSMAFDDAEDADWSDLDLDLEDLEELAKTTYILPKPTLSDITHGFDRAERVRALLIEATF